jgi:hypothetical protein
VWRIPHALTLNNQVLLYFHLSPHPSGEDVDLINIYILTNQCVRVTTHSADEDEDLLNVLLWRYAKRKLWCKWDLEKGLYHNFLNGKVWDEMADLKWFPNGIPLVFLHGARSLVRQESVLLVDATMLVLATPLRRTSESTS